MYKYQILGSFLGTAVGDALGFPVEGKTSEYIATNHGKITEYLQTEGKIKSDGPKKFYLCPLGGWTDDTQLMLATAEAMIEAKGFDMDAIAEHHKKEYNVTTFGWGGSTRSAVKNIAAGSAWSKATEIDYFGHGSGNGVVMKMLPVALYCIHKELSYKETTQVLWNYTSMTHTSVVAQQATFAHYTAIKDVVQSGKSKFDPLTFIYEIYKDLLEFNSYSFYAVDEESDLTKQYERIQKLPLLTEDDPSVEQFRNTIGKGGCYVYESIPLVHAMFLTDPETFNCVINAVNYGGDTDSNASMVGGLHGALVGEKEIPKDLVKGLNEKDRVIDAANKFWELLND